LIDLEETRVGALAAGRPILIWFYSRSTVL